MATDIATLRDGTGALVREIPHAVSPGLWVLAWRRLTSDTVGMVVARDRRRVHPDDDPVGRRAASRATGTARWASTTRRRRSSRRGARRPRRSKRSRRRRRRRPAPSTSRRSSIPSAT